MEDGETVPSVKGTLTSVWPRKAGTNSNGDWSFQNVELTDPTGKIKLKLKDREELPKKMKGRMVYVSCIQSDKHGLTGVKRKEEEYQKDGKTVQESILWITGTADISEEQPAGGEAKEPAAPAQPAPETDPVKAARLAAMRIANGMLIALKAADFVLEQYNTDRDGTDLLDADQYQAITSTIFIAMDRQGVVAMLPSHPLPAKPRQAQQQPPTPKPAPAAEPEEDPDSIPF
jgi:hypothetical protein